MSIPSEMPGSGFLSRGLRQQQLLLEVAAEQVRDLLPRLGRQALAQPRPLPMLPPGEIGRQAVEYGIDSWQRQALFWDTMRRAGNNLTEHEARGCPPVLAFDYQTVMDGRILPRPVNYALVQIAVPEGYPPTDPALRPFVVIDPRAGHGAGIGGFKSDSEVGVALRARHPVYFVVFSRNPEPGQTILDVTAAERAFLREVADRHPKAPKPVVIGNCQGGWAAMLLAASAPELVGPLVLNGAPLSYWAGRTGHAAMRYTGGLVGGAWPVALLSDLGNGRFDGAHLGLNFEALSPGNTWFRKYYDFYAKVDTEAERFLEFERWWSGLFLMNREEIRWIVERLFVGNQLTRDRLKDEAGTTLSIRALRTPVVIFASEGDHITPPGQALRWIADVYRDEEEIRALGQTIVYLVHGTVGHLGIFVSAGVARKEHNEIASTLHVIEAVAPGLYEMRITGAEGEGFQVELLERTVADIRALSGDDRAAGAFAAVADVSASLSRAYDACISPLLRPMVSEATAELGRKLHPLRLRRTAVSDGNPLVAGLPMLAAQVREARRPAPPDNLFRQIERIWAEQAEQALDTWRDLRDAAGEVMFVAAYGWLAAFGIGQAATATEPANQGSAGDGAVAAAPAHYREGGYAEAVVRMMLLLARARGSVRRSRLERSSRLLTSQAPFATMTDAQRQALIRAQSELVSRAPERCLAALPDLLPDAALRQRAMAVVEQVAGPAEELGPPAQAMLGRLREFLCGPAMLAAAE
ncbi:DUF3141 domain-containing protein [Roseicella aquatilis]|uniref:DUF3141 domain-containing protein n=1 Tax=Roseicella aquatilis TaxID=2527868 RepID=A0A4R4DQ90_9PROT|nr:DUF3141 domain-containing protein [Roseicella aquatilis]TCZ62968.1 DUF3141 domain-containing protein [Roseicella aquatilis]